MLSRWDHFLTGMAGQPIHVCCLDQSPKGQKMFPVGTQFAVAIPKLVRLHHHLEPRLSAGRLLALACIHCLNCGRQLVNSNL